MNLRAGVRSTKIFNAISPPIFSACLKGKECRHRGKEVHGKRVECYAEGKINLTGRYNGKHIFVSA